MIPLPNNIRNNDVEQWLWGCWFVNAQTGNPVRYMHVEGPDTVMASTFEGKFEAVRYRDVRVHWPACGAINVDDLALYVQRQQVRQYRRSYSPEHVSVEIPRRWDMMKKGRRQRYNGDMREVVRQLFSPEYPTLDEALTEINRGDVHSRALNRHIVLVGQADKVLVYYGGPKNCVGRLHDGVLVPSAAGLKYAPRVSKLIGVDYHGTR